MKCYFCDKDVYFNWADPVFSACDDCLDKFEMVMTRVPMVASTYKQIAIDVADNYGGHYEALQDVWAEGGEL